MKIKVKKPLEKDIELVVSPRSEKFDTLATQPVILQAGEEIQLSHSTPFQPVTTASHCGDNSDSKHLNVDYVGQKNHWSGTTSLETTIKGDDESERGYEAGIEEQFQLSEVTTLGSVPPRHDSPKQVILNSSGEETKRQPVICFGPTPHGRRGHLRGDTIGETSQPSPDPLANNMFEHTEMKMEA